MSFADDMNAMPPDEVARAVEGRLSRGEGPAWNAARDEPVWGVLVSAFHYWRLHPAQLQAVDATLCNLLPRAVVAKDWPTMEATAAYLLALADLHPAWLPLRIANWPWADWLSIGHPAATSRAQLAAHIALLRLARRVEHLPENWAAKAFASSGAFLNDDQLPESALWTLECWRALVLRLSAQRKTAHDWPWFDLLRHTARLKPDSLRKSILVLAMDAAYALCGQTERSSVASELLALSRHLDVAQADVIAAIAEVFGDTPPLAVARSRVLAPPPERTSLELLRHRDDLPVRRSTPWQEQTWPQAA